MAAVILGRIRSVLGSRYKRHIPNLSRQAIGIGTVGLALGLLFAPIFAHAYVVWTTDDEFSFGLFVPPLTGWLIWLRRRALVDAAGPGVTIGLLPLCSGLIVLLAGTRSGVNTLAAASFLPTVLGIILYLRGIRAGRLVAFPIAFFTVSLCLYRGLLGSMGFAMQRLTAYASSGIAGFLGTPVRRSGVDLFVGPFHFVVAESCSGMNSLMALLCLGTLVVGLTRASICRRLILIALILPIVLVANIIRVTLVLLLAPPFGLAVADSALHGTLSALLFLTALALFFVAGSILRCLPRLDALASF
jgi:exosortase